MRHCRLLPEALSSEGQEQDIVLPMNKTRSDADLVAAVGAGQIGALGELVERHEQAVLALAYRTLGRWDQAQDVAQDVFLRVHRSAHTYRAKSKVTTWLYRITVNICLDLLRRAKREPVAMPDTIEPPAPQDADPLEADERADIVRRAVLALPARQRTALNLLRYQGLSHRQIAEATGWSRSAVESLLVRAYANLREALSDLRER